MNTLARRFASALATLACTLLPMGAAWAVPTITYTSQLNAPGMLRLGVNAAGFTDLYAYQVDLVFNPTLVQATAVTEGPFLQTGGTTFFDGGMVDNVNGLVSFTLGTLLGAGPGVTGSGILESIQFNVLRSGPAMFTFANVLTLDSALNGIAVDQLGATFAAAVPEPGAISLMLAGLGGMTVFMRRRRTAVQPSART